MHVLCMVRDSCADVMWMVMPQDMAERTRAEVDKVLVELTRVKGALTREEALRKSAERQVMTLFHSSVSAATDLTSFTLTKTRHVGVWELACVREE